LPPRLPMNLPKPPFFFRAMPMTDRDAGLNPH